MNYTYTNLVMRLNFRWVWFLVRHVIAICILQFGLQSAELADGLTSKPLISQLLISHSPQLQIQNCLFFVERRKLIL